MEKKVLIIDAGIAGLSVGCYARVNGYDAEIYEAYTQPGGLCTSWKRKGNTFDVASTGFSGRAQITASTRYGRNWWQFKDAVC